jgi:general secretion pathway protein E
VATKESTPTFSFARRHGVALEGWEPDGCARVAVREPGSAQAIAEMRRFLGAPLKLSFYPQNQFDDLLESLYQERDAVEQVASDLDDAGDLDKLVDELPEVEDLLESKDDAPIIRVINALLTEAVKAGASDVHVEPFESRLSVRFRVDGVMREVMSPPRHLAPLLVSRIKVMSRLDIAEKRLPQDGRISLRVAGRPVDVRVSTLPSGHGERVVLRLLDKQSGRLDLEQLGMREQGLTAVTELIRRPHGIILVSGPTGSGKTTSLYAALSRLNDRTRNIMTVEDPIEYYLDGIGQTQVNSKVDLSFARGLRAILRQDPDVVMVGEIRDLETARIAVQASLTGHLVLSTLHTNSAIGVITRLRDMGVEPFLLSSSIIGIIAQRLVRTLDPDWHESYPASPKELSAVGRDASEQVNLYRPQADLPAGVSAYKGRTGIYEVVTVTEAMRGLIHDEAGEQALELEARKHSPGILDDGWHKAVDGVTTLDEILRVTREG